MLKIAIRASALVILVVFSLLASPTIANTEKSPEAYAKPYILVPKETKVSEIKVQIVAKSDNRVQRLANFFKSQGSPLAPYAADFVSSADKYGLDWKLLPAIAGLESSYGLFVPAGSYNAYGWHNGNFYFKGWADATDKVAAGIKEKWASLGTITPRKIGPHYAASPTWADRVDGNMRQIAAF